MIPRWKNKSPHSINIWDIVPKVVRLCWLYYLQSYAKFPFANVIFLKGVLFKYAIFSRTGRHCWQFMTAQNKKPARVRQFRWVWSQQYEIRLAWWRLVYRAQWYHFCGNMSYICGMMWFILSTMITFGRLWDIFVPAIMWTCISTGLCQYTFGRSNCGLLPKRGILAQLPLSACSMFALLSCTKVRLFFTGLRIFRKKYDYTWP